PSSTVRLSHSAGRAEIYHLKEPQKLPLIKSGDEEASAGHGQQSQGPPNAHARLWLWFACGRDRPPQGWGTSFSAQIIMRIVQSNGPEQLQQDAPSDKCLTRSPRRRGRIASAGLRDRAPWRL